MSSIRDPRQFLSNLLKKPRRHVGGIWLQILVTFDEECSNRRREYTRLETIYKGKRGANANQPFKKTHIDEDSIHVILPTFNHFGVMLVGV
jgi:hypothetical protein